MGGSDGELLLNGYRVSIWDDEKILEKDVIVEIMNAINAAELSTGKWLKWQFSCSWSVFTTIKQRERTTKKGDGEI